MTTTTYWISAYRGLLSVSDKHPNSAELVRHQICCIWMWPALGLPHEPAPGECWEVRWEERNTTRGLDDPFAVRMVPIARNVTAELKEAARD